MIHHTCDRCQCKIDPKNELRYEVRIEIEIACDDMIEDYQDDNVASEVAAELCAEADADIDALNEAFPWESGDLEMSLEDEIYQQKRFDLCTRCYRKYVKNPLAREFQFLVGFSQN